MTTDCPITHIYDLGNLPQAGADVHIVLKPEALQSLAKWAGVSAVEKFTADIELKKLSLNGFSLEMRWSADVVQSCVVTLDPVTSHLTGALTRELNLIRRQRRPVATDEAAPVPGLDEEEA